MLRNPFGCVAEYDITLGRKNGCLAMWLLLGLLGSITALSASDLFMQADEEDESGASAESQDKTGDINGWPDDAGGLRSDYPDVAVDGFGPELGAQPADDPVFPGMGLFDDLGLRIHSTDTFPEPAAENPLDIAGDQGDDRLLGATLDDTLSGLGGNDSLSGAGGDDRLMGDAGNDSLIGGEGADTLFGGAGNDTLVGGSGPDLLIAGTGNNTLMAGDGDDTLIGQAGQTFLNGGTGNDLLQGASGNYLNGGAGDDIFFLSPSANSAPGPVHIVDFAAAEDVIQLSYDAAHGVPELSITFAPDQPDLAQIRLGDTILATVANAGALTVDDIALVAQPNPAA
jgi:Ca2+-binding RTX toxin-like protein